MLMQSHHEIFCQALGPLAPARLIDNIFWNIVPVSASSTRTSLPALPALLTALLHRKISTKLFARLFAKLFSSSLSGVIKKRCFNTVQWQGHQCGHAGRSLVAAPRGLCDSPGFFR